MNLFSFLLCFVFVAIGYVVHPVLLPALVSSELVSETALSSSSKEKQIGEVSKDTSIEEVGEKEKIETVVEKQPKTNLVPVPTHELQPNPEQEIPEQEIPEVVPTIKLSEQEFINVLKSSVKAGDVNEFEFEQVLEWKLIGEEGAYQVGMVTYKAETIFDVQQLKAKALVQDGKVVKWLWPTTNNQMR